MNQDLNRILQSMQHYMYQQDSQIRNLQLKIQEMEKKIKDLQSRPPVHVERMEYKFDQLKVETLAGTLNIGLNPTDLQAIEDLSVPQRDHPISTNEKLPIINELEEVMHQFLEANLQNIMNEARNTLNIAVDDNFHEFISQDIKKQLPQRIEYYMNQVPNNQPMTEDQQKAYILEQMQKEVRHGVYTFLENLPENMKGKNAE